ncbi:MAG TPA: TIGR03067 domain-containing protein [Gemmataceae bacterium]|jgi:uncharacterized protein (TIGR03067 family)|nr:TIGR03067 domain-containing protein [Gemmataceae bacterium]
MKSTILGIMAISFLASAGDAKDDAAKKDLEKLAGKWVMSSLEIDGKEVPEDKLKGTTLEIKGDQYTVKTKDDTHEVTLKLDPSKNPKEIDMIFPNGNELPKVRKGIYEIGENTFKVCRGQADDAERPKEFGTWPNTGVFMVVWKKSK